ncbi:MAG TPA: hypothetical protein VFR86_17865, partial [Burkholderiaceae bacterium]|nr:hypothetical protein [Burkholderiaceae bacterium]
DHVDRAARECGASFHDSAEFDVRQQLCDRVESGLASALGLSINTVREMLDLLAKDSALTLADLQAMCARRDSRSTAPRAPGSSSKPASASESSRGSQAVFPAPAAALAAAPAAGPHVTEAPALPWSAEAAANEPASPARSPTSSIGGAKTTGDETGGPLPELPEAVAACLRAVLRLARATGVADCVRTHGALPLGFYVDVPDLDGAEMSLAQQSGVVRHPRAAAAWWLLVDLSGQASEGVAQLIGPDSAFVATWRDEQRYAEVETAVLGPPPTEAVINWILDRDESGELLLELLRLVRAAHAQHPDRFLANAR